MPSHKPVFFDEKRRRWQRMRRLGEILGGVLTLLLLVFLVNVARQPDLPQLMLPETKSFLHGVRERAFDRPGRGRAACGACSPRARTRARPIPCAWPSTWAGTPRASPP